MFRKKDLMLIAAIVAVSVLLAMMMQGDVGATIHITIDGELYGAYSLSENQSIPIDSVLGYNRIVVENGSAYVVEADCPDKYCMDYKPILNGGETIVCLPHKLVVEVVGERSEQQPDVIVPR